MNRHLNRAANLLLLLLFTLSQLQLMALSFGCTIDGSLPFWAAALCVSAWIPASFRRGAFTGLPLSAAILYAACRRYGFELIKELSDLFDKITGVYYEHFYATGKSFGYSDLVQSHTLLFIFLAFLLSAYMVTALTSKNSRVLLALTGSLPLFGGCIAVNGSPEAVPVICMLLFWILLLVSGGSYEPEGDSGRAFFIVLLPVLLVLCIIFPSHAPNKYEYDAEDYSISQRFDQIASAISRWMKGGTAELSFLPPASVEGDTESTENGSDTDHPGPVRHGDGKMDLTEAYDHSAAHELMLRAKADEDAYIYLRSRSYGDYTGTGWLPAEEAPGASSLQFAALAAAASPDSQDHRMQLRFAQDLCCLCLPYYSATASDSDIFVPNDSDSYSLQYLSFGGDMAALRLPEEYLNAELEYRSFAHDYYTRLPDGTGSALLELAYAAGIYKDSPTLIQQVAELVQSSAGYSLVTQPYPSDDYAVYFLTQAQSGYCVHFATAAAAMYRALGVPARVTEGFLFRAESGKFTDVWGKDAHAWVEIYIDALGWVPIEVTGSSGESETAPVETPPQESDTPLTQEDNISAPTQAPEKPDEPESTPALPVGLISSQPQENDIRREFPFKHLAAALSLALLLSVIPLRRTLLRKSRLSAITQIDGCKAAVAIWRQAVKLSAYDAEIPRAITDCAEKAAFSPHQISRAELTACRILLVEMTTQVYSGLSPLKRFVFKYFKALI